MSLFGGAPELAHRGCHDSLLTPLGPPTGRSLDAIIVPASRPAENLLPAMVLAAEIGAPLVALASGATKPAAVKAVAAEAPGLDYAVVSVPAEYEHWLVDFRTSTPVFRTAQVGRLGDLSLKRNLGVLLGRLAGWRSILFLDDDIRGLCPAEVRRAVAALPVGGAVGLPATDFPDNSVVCHANRLAGKQQDVFVSGSALLVDEHVGGFFPRIYNEDWLYLADALDRGAVGMAGEVGQLVYDPFLGTERAEAEEFGDVLAEGLVALLHCGRSVGDATVGYWEQFLVARQRLIGDIRARVPRSGLIPRPKLCPVDAGAVHRALNAAEGRHGSIKPIDLESYVAAWQADLVSWRRRLDRLHRPGCLQEGLRLLGLAAAAQSGLADPMASIPFS